MPRKHIEENIFLMKEGDFRSNCNKLNLRKGPVATAYCKLSIARSELDLGSVPFYFK